ncbi:MAG: glycosyltransferase family 4 protein [Paenibacillus macerans]|uniref:glycosyltransferase family 4 protein n=1 Tax=Paenibacillus TaxID=44249 RepID=UPI00097A4FED|nr:glycosyltransferase family 4 protein [Paenibacillus macerans]MBS5912599.1 glycosyltransferase family 4 protein [Paenibacillus macerans]MDU5946476.1 glycosyltransferase family 4 protein [Paenibacillus macerans]MDU7476988.1 glycosyltransferase family 4 protein [Paenibacillus macerans]MEC0137530.1 glycosyltransferase family 4 protein [Paenibacillus macerans]MEC0333214.1 glycosyltransferase family 4 protein [Paenibacillus macerans]
MTRVAYVSTYVPKKCGLATFTYHLRQSVNAAKEWKAKDPVVVLHDGEADGPTDPLLWLLRRNCENDYEKMANKINNSDIEVVSLQHEFGIFGGEAGRYILRFIRALNKPLVTTFHTVFEHPREPYAGIQREIAERSARIVVMNRKAISYLNRSFGIPEDKIVFIPHGTPEPDTERRQTFRERLDWSDRKVLMTFGLLSRGKGIELILKVLPEIVKQVPHVLYAIVGQTHPEVKKWEGEKYREELRTMIEDNGIGENVVMIDRYMEENDLVRHITACDVYVTPYPGLEQITSGTLAYAVGLGRPVLSTPYCYAQDLLEGEPDLLIAADAQALWRERIVALLTNEVMLQDVVRKMKRLGQTMHWPNVGSEYHRLFTEVGRYGAAIRSV